MDRTLAVDDCRTKCTTGHSFRQPPIRNSNENNVHSHQHPKHKTPPSKDSEIYLSQLRCRKAVLYYGRIDHRPIVLSGPSGSGKSTLIQRLFREYPDTFGFNTTRDPRPGEENGIDYHFTTKDDMLQKIANNSFLEHVDFSGNFYGTAVQAVQSVQDSGKICVLDIDLRGVQRLRASNLDARYIFIRPKDMTILEQRLRDRATETEDDIQKRLETARADWIYGTDPNHFDHVVVNDSVDKAYADLCAFIFAL
ncbi:hypothetical protein BG004_003712 [Podila humilis]|nr:hypothetical protein BG004_003712 [Podila humilis]